MSNYVPSAKGGWLICICRCSCGHAAGSHVQRNYGLRECKYCECVEHGGCDRTNGNPCREYGYPYPSTVQVPPWIP
jgi:hypothetical protein